MEQEDSHRSLMNKSDLLGLFDDYLEEEKIYEQYDGYDEVIEKILEYKKVNPSPSYILGELLVYLDEEYGFHPDKDLDGEELSDVWKEDMTEMIKQVIQ